MREGAERLKAGYAFSDEFVGMLSCCTAEYSPVGRLVDVGLEAFLRRRGFTNYRKTSTLPSCSRDSSLCRLI